jgi:hypothetical protein
VTHGRIFVDGKRFVIDAEPHVMSRIRSMFDTGRTYHAAGQFTHRPILLPMTLSAARDLVWVLARYPLSLTEETSDRLDTMAREYDAIVAAAATAANDETFILNPGALELGLPLRPHQAKFRNAARVVRRMLLADKMGLGKTAAAISLLCERESRPAIIVVPAHLRTQWAHELARFLPGASSFVARGMKATPLPPVDAVVVSYNCLQAWQDELCGPDKTFPTVVFDEVHELRHVGTTKRDLSRLLSTKAETVVGLTGTPIFNYGAEIWSVVDVVSPDALGPRDDFVGEWCHDKKVREPAVLNAHLKSRGLFLRRTPEDVGLDFGTVSRHVYTLDSDMEKLREVQSVAKMLAISVLSGSISSTEDWSDSARQFDWKLRHATGVAKARPVAEFVKLLCEQGEKVVLAGWHRDVYDVWEKELFAYKPVMYTGTESPSQKEAAKQKFIEDPECKVFVISLRSGAGIDGLQYASNTVVFGELDWSPHVMDQVVSRVFRDGQTKHVQAFFLTVNDGADPFMTQVLNLKRSQHDGLVEGLSGEAQVLESSFSPDRIREMAKAYLASIGETVPEPVRETGLLGDVARALRRIRVPANTEAELQDALGATLPSLLESSAALTREVRIGKRSRLDFLATLGDERVAIECKVTSTGRKDVYRQVRRYAEEAQITALVLFAPWGGVPSFTVDGVPVVVVDFSAAAL